jgi:hypothetical protein
MGQRRCVVRAVLGNRLGLLTVVTASVSTVSVHCLLVSIRTGISLPGRCGLTSIEVHCALLHGYIVRTPSGRGVLERLVDAGRSLWWWQQLGPGPVLCVPARCCSNTALIVVERVNSNIAEICRTSNWRVCQVL